MNTLLRKYHLYRAKRYWRRAAQASLAGAQARLLEQQYRALAALASRRARGTGS